MPTVTLITGHSATITNFGPLTTTYTAPTSCATATDHLYFAGKDDPGGIWAYPMCTIQTFGDCIPSGDAFDELMTSYDGFLEFGFYHYYSPGLYCPSGWTTAATLVNPGGNTAAEVSGYLTQDYSLRLGEWEPGRAQPTDPTAVWEQILEPSETLAICCPSGYKGDNNGDCYSVLGPITSYGYTEICGYIIAEGQPDAATPRIRDESETVPVWTGEVRLEPTTIELQTAARNGGVVATRVPAVALIYQESDLPEPTGESGDEGSRDGDSEEEEDGGEENSALGRPGIRDTPLLPIVIFSIVAVLSWRA
ncbi:hypothetical protein ACJ41O_012970 [Fusarium nematophilum]